jgi:hypothetical protein
MPEKPLVPFDRLTSIANNLNKATDELTKVVGVLDNALQRLNVGIPVWVIVIRWYAERDPTSYEGENVGYAKIDGSWCIGISRVVGDEASPEPDEVREIWPFNDAPREARLRAVEKLPELIDQLAKSAEKTAEVVDKKLAETKAFAAAIGLLPIEESAVRGKK